MMAVHPGRILKREIAERNLTAHRLALQLRLPANRVTEIAAGRRGISPETALRLARYFGNSARFWLNLQAIYELALVERKLGAQISAEVDPAGA